MNRVPILAFLFGVSVVLGCAVSYGEVARYVDPFQPRITEQQVQQLEAARDMRKAGKIDEAIANLNQLLSDNPDYYRAPYQLGLAYMDKRDYKSAIAAFDMAMSIKNRESIQDATIYNTIGWSHLVSGNYRESEKFLLQAVETKENSPDPKSKIKALNNLGLLYLYQGNHEKSKEYLSLAAKEHQSKLAEERLKLVGQIQTLVDEKVSQYSPFRETPVRDPRRPGNPARR